MYPGAQAKIPPHQPAFVTAAGGDTVTYAGLELCSNRLADFLRASGQFAATLAADVTGYSPLMGADEEGTLGAPRTIARELGDPKIPEHRGRIILLRPSCRPSQHRAHRFFHQARIHSARRGSRRKLRMRAASFSPSLASISPVLTSMRRHFCRLCLDWTERRPHLAWATIPGPDARMERNRRPSRNPTARSARGQAPDGRRRDWDR